jgi:predicted RNA-binding Zn-ribbon protein involved in translation (DUF1610 family)
MKKAFLVTANVTTRVVVDVPETIDEFAYDKIIKEAKDRLIHNLNNDYADQIEDVREDKDVPYNPINDDVVDDTSHYTCPICGETWVKEDWNYIYNTGFECPLCGWVETKNDVDIDNEK